MACDGHPEAVTTQTEDSTSIPDSVPRMVRAGKEADWAYKPDTMVNDILLGDDISLTNFKRKNGNEGENKSNGVTEMVYVNALETEQLTIYQLNEASKPLVYGYRVKKNPRTKDSPPASNYALDRNFMSSAGIYIGMPIDYVQNIYKSQPMMLWTKGDTTYLSYAPSEKDKEHFKRYATTDYSALYKFVNDNCVLYEVFIDIAAFAKP